jgi:cytochrome c peroxidase
VDREIHDLAFAALKSDGSGTVLYQVPATTPPTPVLASEPENEFLNLGTAMQTYLAQLGATEHDSFTRTVSFPGYRYRFYTDGSRSEISADLPFDVPTLRGIANTAPYFHNNTSETLEAVVELYSDHLLSRFPSLTQPGEKEPDEDGDTGPEEALTADQKKDLVTFLRRL